MSSFVNTMTSLSVKQGKQSIIETDNMFDLAPHNLSEVSNRIFIFIFIFINVTCLCFVLQWRMEKCLTSEAWDWIGSGCRCVHKSIPHIWIWCGLTSSSCFCAFVSPVCRPTPVSLKLVLVSLITRSLVKWWTPSFSTQRWWTLWWRCWWRRPTCLFSGKMLVNTYV